MFYNLISFVFSVILYVSLFSIIAMLYYKIKGVKNKTINSSIAKMLLLSLITFYVSNTLIPNYALHPKFAIEEEGVISPIDKSFIVKNAMGNATFKIGEDIESEWVSASYGNILQFEISENDSYTYKKYDRLMAHYVVQVPQEDWDEIVHEFGEEITHSILERWLYGIFKKDCVTTA